jgi:hypothetical protein
MVILKSLVGTQSDPSDAIHDIHLWISILFSFASPGYPKYP